MSMSSDAPRVFISYSGDDSTRFVERFAVDLRARGVDAWYTGWEIQPGDSLVQKVMGEGLAKAEAVIVVLSRSSVTRPWIEEELDHATIRRIEEKIRLIPVKIEDCAIPPALRTLRRVNFSDPASYEPRLQEIVDVLFSYSRKPSVGAPPAYTATRALAGYTQLEWTILELLGSMAWEGNGYFLDNDAVYDHGQKAGLTPEQLTRTLERLKARGRVDGQKALGADRFLSLKLTVHGAASYCRARASDFEAQKTEVAAWLVSFDPHSVLNVTAPEGMSPLVFQVVIDELENSRFLKRQWFLGGGKVLITSRSPLLDDWIEQR